MKFWRKITYGKELLWFMFLALLLDKFVSISLFSLLSYQFEKQVPLWFLWTMLDHIEAKLPKSFFERMKLTNCSGYFLQIWIQSSIMSGDYSSCCWEMKYHYPRMSNISMMGRARLSSRTHHTNTNTIIWLCNFLIFRGLTTTD